MTKRVVLFFSVLMTSICVLMVRIYVITTEEKVIDASSKQSFYTINVCNIRGKIFDCKKRSLTNKEYETVACIAPSLEAANELSRVLDEKEAADILYKFTESKPFAVKLDNIVNRDISSVCDKLKNSRYINIFKVPKRYEKDQRLRHVIGYVGEDGGICGIEKAYNDYLSGSDNKISVRYKVDALNRFLPGAEKIIDDNSYMQNRGVVLTIDSQIQDIAEEVSKKYLKKGAVLITETPSCKIRALVSLPEFSYDNIEDDLKSCDSPFINRAFAAYNVGSTFKLVTAAAALEEGVHKDLNYQCTGNITVDDFNFHCFNGVSHGDLDMCRAMALSCNSYFVVLSQMINKAACLGLARKLGFGESIEFCKGLCSQKGTLPQEKDLECPKVLANFSFGQGVLMATPVQIAGLINTIASCGLYSKPSIVEGITKSNLEFLESTVKERQIQVFSRETAESLKEFMRASAEFGTGRKGTTDTIPIAAKTATAQTGIKVNGRDVIQAWYTGFFPIDREKTYSMVVLSEDGQGGANSCGPVFKEIVESMQSAGII